MGTAAPVQGNGNSASRRDEISTSTKGSVFKPTPLTLLGSLGLSIPVWIGIYWLGDWEVRPDGTETIIVVVVSLILIHLGKVLAVKIRARKARGNASLNQRGES